MTRTVEINATGADAAPTQPVELLNEPDVSLETVDGRKEITTADHAAYERSRRIALLKFINENS